MVLPKLRVLRALDSSGGGGSSPVSCLHTTSIKVISWGTSACSLRPLEAPAFRAGLDCGLPRGLPGPAHEDRASSYKSSLLHRTRCVLWRGGGCQPRNVQLLATWAMNRMRQDQMALRGSAPAGYLGMDNSPYTQAVYLTVPNTEEAPAFVAGP